MNQRGKSWNLEINIDEVKLGVVLEMPTGVHYTHQSGGFSCFRGCAEGVLAPLRNTFVERHRDGSVVGPYSRSEELGSLFDPAECGRPLDVERADQIDAVLARGILPLPFRVDRDRLSVGMEAWVPVTHEQAPNDMLDHLNSPIDSEARRIGWSFYGFRAGRAVLLWPNSD